VPLVRSEDPSASSAEPAGVKEAGLPGLTREETALLAELRRLGEVDARALARKSGFRGATLSLALDRLRRLRYINAVRRKGVTLFSAKISKG
jgi:DNA-binding MarR family transcriptional regulator